MTIVLDGESLTTEELAAIARGTTVVRLAPAAWARMSRSRSVVQASLQRGDPVYGLNTGVAERKQVRIEAAELRPFNRRLVRAHRVAQGPSAPPAVVRAAMALLVNAYAKGFAGVRPELAQMILDALNAGFVPSVRSLGSVGQADLGPMADLADALLRHSGFELAENEGLALVNSNAFSTAWAALAQCDAERLLDTADVAAALDLEGYAANINAFHIAAADARPYAGIRSTIEGIHRLLEGSSLFDPGIARNLQDPLTFRCVPQIHGAARDAFGYASSVVGTEINCAQGNPAVVADENRVISIANFEILPLAAAMDFSRIALSPVLTSAMERTVKLLQRPSSGLPAGLAASDDTGDDALAEFSVATQSLAVEARVLAAPVSAELASTSKADGIEDRTSMAPLAARRLGEMVALGARVIAIEMVVAARAIDLRRLERLGVGTANAHAMVRSFTAATGEDDLPPDDLEPLIDAIRNGQFTRAAVLHEKQVDDLPARFLP